MKKKLLLFVLAAVMVVSAFAGCAPSDTPSDSTKVPSGATQDPNAPVQGRVVIGSTTQLAGDFRWPGFGGSSAGAADIDINVLTTGYDTMEVDQFGAYQWNKTSVKSHTEKEDEDGNYVVTIEINEGLKFSDGSEIKAANYLAYILAMSTEVAANAGGTGTSGEAYVGFESYNAYIGEGSPEGATKEFAGVRLLSDYSFSLTIAAPDYYPYYYAYTYGAVGCYPLALVLGDGVEVKDDGNGAYLTDAWYEHTTTTDTDDDGEEVEVHTFPKSDHIKEARFDVSKYPFSGPYTISEWDSSTSQCTLKVNPLYVGNYEGQKPHIETIVYVLAVQETMIDALKSGQIDVLDAVTGADDTNAALDVVNAEGSKYKENHYTRAGYGKIQFDCDFSPTMFAEVRQAVTYLLDKDDFARTFTGGYGAVVYGPYSVDFAMWQAVKDTITLNSYDFSEANARKVLEDGGWTYNSKGEAYTAGQTGVDAVRYKKLTADEATDLNINYASVANDDGVEYKTVKVGDDYYMPLVINWASSENNAVSELIRTKLALSEAVANVGMVIRGQEMDFNSLLGEIYRLAAYGFDGNVKFSMYNLATGWNSSIYDYAYNWSLDPRYFGYSVNKLFDEYDVDFPYYDENGNHTKLSYKDAMAASGNKLGMDYISFAMVYDATTEAEYNEWWQAYIERWNLLVPEIPLYGNYYYNIYNQKIEGFAATPFRDSAKALLYCTCTVAD